MRYALSTGETSLKLAGSRDARSNQKVEVGVVDFNYNGIPCEKIAIILLSAYYYSECKKMFLEISTEQIYSEVIKQLKKRIQIIKEEFVKVPYELKFLSCFINYAIFNEKQFECVEVKVVQIGNLLL